MRHTEKKYRVETFEEIEKNLADVGAALVARNTSNHYYAQQSTGVIKLVMHGDKGAIHILDESEGTFTLRESIPVENDAAGLQWLKDKGFDKVSRVTMSHTDYKYEGGIVGLYVINGWLHSVILDYPNGLHEEIANKLGLTDSEVITLPYDKYIESQENEHSA